MKMKMKRLLALCLAVFLCAPMVPTAPIADAQGTDSTVTILYTNDIHTYIDGDLTYSMVAGYRDTLDNVLLVDAGDHIQGTAYGGMDKGETIIEMMNATGYDVATLGNHEFDYGMEGALQAVAWAQYPYISCNFYHEEDGVVGENVLDSYQVFEVEGIRIAFVGITTPDSISKSSPKYFQDDDGNYIYGIAGGSDGQELYASVQRAIDAASQEADVVVALGHLGVDASSSPWTSEEVIANTSGLDAFIDGHSHTTMECEYVTDLSGEEVLLTQTGYYFSALGEMTITQDGDISTKLLTADDLSDVTPDADVQAIETGWIAEIDETLGEKIAESDIEFTLNDSEGNRLIRKGETNIGDLNADAYYWYMNEADGVGCDIAIMNGGGIRSSVEAGDWTYLTSKNINPYGNVLCVVEASGQDILDALEFGARYTPIVEAGGFMHVAGLSFDIDTSIENTITEDESNTWVSGPTEYRVQNVKVYDKETGVYKDLDLDATYTIGGTNYTLRNCGGGFNMFSDVVLVKDYIVEDYMAIAEYVKSFADSDGNGYANISTANSPLYDYAGYLLDYEDAFGSGRITVIDGTTQVDDTESEDNQTATDDTSATTTDPQTATDPETTIVPESVSIGGTYTVGDVQYKVTASNTVSFTGVVKKKKTVKIPSYVTISGKKYKVISIQAKALKGDKKVRKVVIPATVKKIGNKAFFNCKKLKTIRIKSKKCKSVGKKAIYGIHKKAKIRVPKGKKAMYKKVFTKKTGYRGSMRIK